MDKTMQTLISKLGKLNDKIFSLPKAEFNRMVNDLLSKLEERSIMILTDRGLKSHVNNTIDKFDSKLGKKTSLSDKSKNSLTNALAKQYKSQIKKLIGTTESLQRQKRAVGEIRYKAQAKVDARLIKTNPSLDTVSLNVGGKEITLARHSFNNITDKLNTEYGYTDTVNYRDGKNYPVESYLDGKIKTTENEVNRAVSVSMASKTGVLVGKISAHSATDSCRPWENAYVFFSESAKRLFEDQNPDINVSGIPTLEDAEADKESHIFKHRCKHTIYPIINPQRVFA